MIILTTDPVTGETLHDLNFKPFIIEGKGHLAVKVYFESEATRHAYLHQHHRENNAASGINH